MSKSNLKNINNLLNSKEPFILYNKSSYTNLLYKVKKSIVWCSVNTSFLNKIFFYNNQNFHFKYFLTKKYFKYFKYRKYRKGIHYNPLTLNNIKTSNEVFFIKKM